MTARRYTPRRSDHPGSPWWYVHDAVTGGEAPWSPAIEHAAGIPDDCPGYTEAQARAVCDLRNACDIPTP